MGELLTTTNLSTRCGLVRAVNMLTLPPVAWPSRQVFSTPSWEERLTRSEDICFKEGLRQGGELPWFLASGMMTDLLVR